MKTERGFTLIELMIVVAIIALLAALAFPAYQDYMARAQVSEGLTLASGARTAVTQFHAERSGYPLNNVHAGLALPGSITGRYVTAVTVGPGTGAITVDFGNEASALIAGQALVMQLSNHGGSLQWSCGGLPPKLVPSACR